MIELFRAVARLVLDKKEYDQDLKDADQGGKSLSDKLSGYMDKVKKAVAAIGIGVAVKKAAGYVNDLVNEVSAAGDKIDKQSQALGLSRKAYQEWEYILAQSGASIDSLAGSMRTLTNGLTTGNEEFTSALGQLGLSVQEITSLDQEQAFDRIVKALQRMPAGTTKSALAMTLLGRGAAELMPLLNSSTESIDDLRKSAYDLGLFMSDDAVDASVAYGDALDDMKRVFQSIKYSIGASVLPALTGLVKNITGYTGKIKKAYEKGGLSNVFQVLWQDITGFIENIPWPTWDQVKDAASRAWNTIKDGAKELAGLVFGKKEDGSVDWPDWDDVKAKAAEIWGNIKTGAIGIATEFGAIVFGKKADGSVDWPDWDDVKAKASEAWENIKNGAVAIATEFGALVFGKKEDGSVDWPDWDTVKAKAEEIWGTIKEKITDFAGLVFGKKENGSVAWPEWPQVREAAINAWNGIKNAAKNIFKFVFGESDDGGIKFLEPMKVWAKIESAFSRWWRGVGRFLGDAAKWLLPVFGVPEETGEQIGNFVRTWFDSIVSFVEGACNWVLSLFGFADNATVKEHFRQWWEGEDGQGGVKSMIKQVANWVLGALGFPSVDEIVNQIQDWWYNQVIPKVNLVVDFLLHGTDTPTPTFEVGGQSYPDPFGAFDGVDLSGLSNYYDGSFAKGLNYSPYDGYRAILHRGEMVLNQADSRQYRQGLQQMDFSGLYSAIAGAVREGMKNAQVNAYMDGKRVTRESNRIIATELQNARFGAV